MASDSPDAVRKRRSRRHVRGDHSICLPDAGCRHTSAPVAAPLPTPGTPREMLEQERWTMRWHAVLAIHGHLSLTAAAPPRRSRRPSTLQLSRGGI
jgi:hypothetical protein